MATSLSTDSCRLLDGANFGHLATLMASGEPKVEPVWIAREQERVLVATDAKSIKVRNVDADARVALSVTAFDNPYEQLLVRGVVTEVRPDDDLRVLDAMAQKYLGTPFPRRKWSRRVVLVIEPFLARYYRSPLEDPRRSQLSPDELLSTTRAVRRRLDLDRPVPRATVEECLRLAFQAPNGGNGQEWGWVVVDDPNVKAELASLYRAGLHDHVTRDRSGESPDPAPANEAMSRSVQYLVDNMERVPTLVVPAIGRRYGGATSFQQASRWGSILPAVWSFHLALRSRGLGSAWTTLHLYREREVADLLGIPHDDYLQAGLFPVAYTIGTDFRPADRSRSAARIGWNRWPEPSTTGRD